MNGHTVTGNRFAARRALMLFATATNTLASGTAPAAPGPDVVTDFARIISYLLLIIVIIAVTVWLMRRLGHYQYSAQGKLRVLDSLPVGTREKILLIEVGKQQLLVGITPTRLDTLHVLSENIDLREHAAPTVQQWASQLRDRWRQGSSR